MQLDIAIVIILTMAPSDVWHNYVVKCFTIKLECYARSIYRITVIVSFVIVVKKVQINMCQILNGYQDAETLIVISLAVFDMTIHINNSYVSGYY